MRCLTFTILLLVLPGAFYNEVHAQVERKPVLSYRNTFRAGIYRVAIEPANGWGSMLQNQYSHHFLNGRLTASGALSYIILVNFSDTKPGEHNSFTRIMGDVTGAVTPVLIKRHA